MWGETPQNIARNMVLTYLHLKIQVRSPMMIMISGESVETEASAVASGHPSAAGAVALGAAAESAATGLRAA